ncbi:MAG: glucosaminidase domain-containing protein [Candidatus Cryptobacteroides sp.]
MKKFDFIVILLAAVCCFTASIQTVQKEYIAKYSEIAVSEMYRSGIPASITLAQGLLESGSGRSELATKANNHFGIKCHNDWTGAKSYHDDDRKGECFRKYAKAEDSFMDHSDFLRYRDRYKFLFDLKTTDYKGWAYGLKRAGYATDPEYPSKLIKLIEDYRLYEYDEVRPSKDGGKPSKDDKKPKRDKHTENVLPEPPLRLEQVKPLSDEQKAYFSFAMSREMYSQNGVPFIYAMEGETYDSIAKNYNLFSKEIRRFNDVTGKGELVPGSVVYLQAKKSQTAKGLDKYVWEEGDSLIGIAQRFAVTVKSLKKMNGIKDESLIRPGDVIKLRK